MSGVPAWAVRGAKVVCVDAIKPSGRPFGKYIALGKTYTIRSVAWCHGANNTGYVGPALHLVEVDRKGGKWGMLPFRLSRFRPVIPQKTEALDIALFRDALTQRTPEDA